MSKDDKLEVDMVAETENFAVWRSPDENGYVYHVELGSITLHLDSEEWEELLELLGELDE